MKKRVPLSPQKYSKNFELISFLKTKAAVYIRVSTEEQAKEGFSLAAQEDSLVNYAKTLDYEIYNVYKDEGKSAKDMKHRPALQHLLKDAEERKFNAVLVYKLDRFSRSLKDLILTIEKLKELEIDFISFQDKIETASASGKLMFHIISSFAEFERDIISERTKFGMEEKAKEGGTITKAPLGYKLVDGSLTVDADKQPTVAQIFNIFLNEDKSLSKLAKQFNMTTRGLINLLKNRTYVGEVNFKGSYRGSHEAIISKELFNKVQEKLENKSFQRNTAKYHNFIQKTLLKGIKFYDSNAVRNLAGLIASKTLIIEEIELSNMEQPKEITSPDEITRHFSKWINSITDKEIFFGQNLEFLFSGANNLSDYFGQNSELWLLTSGSYPWNKDSDSMRCFVVRKLN